MSFYSDASLVLIPSGYKNQKIYSAKPTDGSGDLTFTRASDATRVDSNGLIEKVRTNLALYSQDFSQTGTWVTSTTTRVDSQTDPNGGTTASKFTATGANSNVIQTLSVSSGVPYTWSFWAKSDSATDVNIRLDNNNGNFVQTNMALTTSWQRFSITLNSTATTILCFLGGGVSFTAGEIAYIAFAQLEASDIATDYIATTSAAVSVGPVSGLPRLDYLNSTCPKLLLEPQRTNFATWSEAFSNWSPSAGTITSNATTSPDGYANADLFTEDTTTGYHRIFNSCTGATGTTKTYSIYAKWVGGTGRKWLTIDNGPISYFDLENGVLGNVGANCTTSITSVGNGWYRCVMTHTASAAGTMYVGTANANGGAGNHLGNGQPAFYMWGAQCETAAYATSYIPTLSTSVTRVADAASKTGISSLIGQTEGTIFVDFNLQTPVGNDYVIGQIYNSSTPANGIYFYIALTNVIEAYVDNSGTQAKITTPSALAQGRYKLAIAYKANEFKYYVNGTLIGTDTSGTVPTCDSIKLIDYSNGGGYMEKSAVNQYLIFKTSLTNAQMAELTTL